MANGMGDILPLREVVKSDPPANEGVLDCAGLKMQSGRSEDMEEAYSDKNQEDVADARMPLDSTFTTTSSTPNSSASTSSASLCDEDVLKSPMNGNSSEVVVSQNEMKSHTVEEDGLLKMTQPQHDEQIQTADHKSAGIPVHMKDTGEMINTTEESSHTTTFSDAQAHSTSEVTTKSLQHLNESNSICIKNDTGVDQANTSTQGPPGLEPAKKKLMLSSTTQTAAAPHSSYIEHHEPEMPQADVDSEKTEGAPVNSRETPINVINSRGSVDNTATTVCTTNMNKTDDFSQSSLMSAAQHQPASMGVAASNSWVSFEDNDGTPSSQVPFRSKPDAGEKEGWVKFDTSPVIQRHPMAPQLTGGSSVHSCDPAYDDRQSDVTMSVLSSRGSLSESHDNVSHEYLPLGPSPRGSSVSSPSPQLKPTGAMANWVQFNEPSELPQRQLQSPPLPVPLHASSPPTIQSSASLASPVSSIPSPGHVGSQQNQVAGQTASHGKIQQPGVRPMAGWVSFDEPDSSTSTSPVIPDNSPVNEREAIKKRAQLQQLQQSIALQQQQQIQSRQQNQQQAVVPQLSYQQHPQPQSPAALQNVAVVPQIPSSQSLPYLASSQPASTIPPSTSTPLPGNPFREEMLRQQHRASSPFNPFQSGVIQTPSTPGGTVSAMWGESPITPGTVTAMWEKFEESSEATKFGSPGNPFNVVSGNANLYNAQPQQVALTGPPATERVPIQPQIFNATASPTTVKEQGQQFQEQNGTEQPSITSTSSSTPIQSTPVSSQPFQRYTKASKQVMIRASGKRPKGVQTHQDGVAIDSTPFVDGFPREKCDLAEGWPMMLRCPDKKRVAGSRYWKRVQVKLLDGNVIQLFDNEHSSEPFRELPLQCSYEFGDRKLQAYDTLGKIHTVKLLYVSYSEKRRYNTKAPYEKVMNANPLLKLGSTDYNIYRSFISTVNEHLMKLPSFRDRGISYKQDAVGVVVSDDYRCRISSSGELEKQSISIDVTVLAFLSDMPECSIALNDIQVKGAEVVSRRDIIPNKTNQWIKLENVELHKCANRNVFAESRSIEFQPLDGCRFCLMKFQTWPKQNAELPLHVKVTVTGEGAFLELRVDLLLPARPGRRDPTQFTCDNIMVRIPIPEAWIKYFRRERRLGFYSVKSVHGKPDHIKQGSLNPRLLETSTGSAKYEHAYKAIVWRIERLPERATAFSASHILMCRIHLASHREVPRSPLGDVEVEFTMPQTTASKTTVRSLSVASDKPSEKRIRYMAHYEYFVEIENKVVLQVLDGEEDPAQCSQQ